LAPKSKKSDREAAAGYALMSAPEGVTGCGIDGVDYQADDQGVVEVQSDHVASLVNCGFVAL
jgi:hypothetical protein